MLLEFSLAANVDFLSFRNDDLWIFFLRTSNTPIYIYIYISIRTSNVLQGKLAKKTQSWFLKMPRNLQMYTQVNQPNINEHLQTCNFPWLYILCMPHVLPVVEFQVTKLGRSYPHLGQHFTAKQVEASGWSGCIPHLPRPG